MMKHGYIIFLVAIYVFTQICIEFGKAFNDVGAAKLHDFNWADWTVLVVSTMGTVGVTMMAFFSRAFAQHMADLKSENPPANPPAAPVAPVPKP